MAFERELLHELLEEHRLLFELVPQGLEVLSRCVASEHLGLILVDQRAELLNGDEDFGYELGDLGFLPAKHGLIQNLVEIFIVN